MRKRSDSPEKRTDWHEEYFGTQERLVRGYSNEYSRYRRLRNGLIAGSLGVAFLSSAVQAMEPDMPTVVEWAVDGAPTAMLMGGIYSEFKRQSQKESAEHRAQVTLAYAKNADVYPPDWAVSLSLPLNQAPSQD